MKASFPWLFRLVLMLLGSLSLPTFAAERPNILFVLTDDQGWPTLGCYGSNRVATPRLDRFASEGVRFTQAYAMPQCTPTRAALMSGQHTARTGMWHVLPWYGLPWAPVEEPVWREQYPREWPTLPKALRAAGYRTGMGGKWHLTTGPDGGYDSLKPAAGAAYGFDYVAPPGATTANEGDKWVNHLTDAAIGFMRENRERPWFFYLAHHTLHAKFSAPDEMVAAQRTAGAPESGMHNATYLAMIAHLDESFGRLMTALEETQQAEKTLVVFMSDNGGFDTNYALPKPGADETVRLEPATEAFDNAPLRAGKGFPYEGGLRVPCLVRWPGHAKAGAVCETPIHVVDWMPTLLEAAGAPAPDGHALDGVSFGPLLAGQEIAPRALYWHMPLYDLRWAATPCAVIREGDWKLIEYFGDRFDETMQYRRGRHLELFNLRDDLSEARNAAPGQPARAREMSERLHAWLQSSGARVPGENPHFDKARMFEETRVKPAWVR